MKAIIFDIDGVVIKSNNEKDTIIKDIIKKYGLYEKKGVREILKLGMNRKALLKEIAKLYSFDEKAILDDINKELLYGEENPKENTIVIDFIKNNYSKYIFCTNTSLPISGLKKIIEKLNIGFAFKDLLAFENGTKLENINYILEKYNLKPKEVLFIDDNINHIQKVKNTKIHTLHYTNYDIDIENEIFKI